MTLAQGAFRVPSVEEAVSSVGSRVRDVAKSLAGVYGLVGVSSYDYVGTFTCRLGEAAARRLSHDPRVLSVESNSVCHATGTINPSGWGLDRIDQSDLPLNGAFNYTQTGRQVGNNYRIMAYVVDTGIYPECTDFYIDQVTLGWPSVYQPYTPPGGTALTSSEDDSGHGTAVADIVGGGALGNNARGVAHDVILVPVKSLDSSGTGTLDSVVAGLNWIKSSRDTRQPMGRGVVNMSLAFRYTVNNTKPTALKNAIDALIDSGVTVVVAADNWNKNVSYSCPANLTEVITVGATDQTDHMANYLDIPNPDPNNPGTSYGAGVDIFAPGKNVNAYTYQIQGGVKTTVPALPSGTSFSTPYVTGVVAQYFGNNPNGTPAQAQTWITSNATQGRIVNEPSGTPDRLLFTSL